MKEKYNVILDTDIGNSWDDQFALAYLLKNEDLFNIEAITIEPFKHIENESIMDNQEISYNEIINISKFLSKDIENKIYEFSNNDSVEKIIEIANKNDKTYILAIGALSNISLAINKNPNIINKIEIIWIGGNSLEYGNNKEFNFMQDTKATLNVINSNITMTIIPAKNVAIDLMIRKEELEQRLDINKEISRYLCDRFVNDGYYGVKDERVIWDISVIAYLVNKEWFEIKKIKGLSLSEDLQYYTNSNTSTKTIVEKLDNKKIYDDLFEVLNK